ncbi:MAG: hypothetical protein M1825_001135 [Sarcosagium campestre]|nr:MAG: hypothetical protein M1825_001135 [Sarcosagium campestre]
MPADIRNFFGGGTSQGSITSTQKSTKKDEEKNVSLKRKRGKARKVIDDSDEENEEVQKTPPKRVASHKKVKQDSPKGEAVTSSDYFQSSTKSKPTRSTPTKPKTSSAKPKDSAASHSTPQKSNPTSTRSKPTPPAKPSVNGRASSRKKKPTSYVELDDDDDAPFVEDDKDAGDDIFTADFKKGGKARGDDYVEDEDEEEEEIKPKKRSGGKRNEKPPVDENDEDFLDDDVDLQDIEPLKDEAATAKKQVNGKKATKPSPKAKRKAAETDDDDDAFDPPAYTPKKPAPVKKPTPKKARVSAKTFEAEESTEVQNIHASIPTVRPPTPPAQTGETRKFDFKAQAQRSAPPPGAGTKDIPIGQENCLVGLSFVFTGILESLDRDKGTELVKKYGGKTTTAPSRKTSYVVLGSEAGPKKLELIRKNNIKTIDEDGLFELIRRMPANGGDSKAAAAHEEKRQKEEEKVKQMAAEMEKADRKAGGAGGVRAGATAKGTDDNNSVDGRLWTTKYAPSATNQICGNKGQVAKLQNWLREWPKNQKINFKKSGPDGSYAYRAVIIHGPPGIGKTTAAHLVAKLEGYDVLESNASDTRSKKLVETGLKGILDNTSLMGYFAADDKKVETEKKKLVLIMDEVDGMSAGDRGGVGALSQVCKKTHIPMILICNDRRLPKMKPFDFVTYDLPFRRPTTVDIRSRIATICYREGLKLAPQILDALIEGSNADIRQIINMVSTVKVDEKAMDFENSKSMAKAWEKHIILKPWDIAHKLLSTGMFSPSSTKTLNDKIELYFNDHEFSFLMLQENYLKTNPSVANNLSGRERRLKVLELADKAAESISDGDLVDRMIHGSQQQWSLMPTHAVFSTVRPASFVYGNMTGQASFTSWLGNNSKYGKLKRFVGEIQGHMRLRASGDRHEIRQQYLPALWSELIDKLQREGKEAVDEVIKTMDSYFLTREDFDAIMELGVGPMSMEKVSLDTQTKSTFTRLYNQQSHPLPFMKASTVTVPKKAAKDKPDLEEAIEDSDADEAVPDKDAKEEDDDNEAVDLSKDKYVKQPKKKKAPAKKAPAKKKSKVDDDEDVEDVSEEDVKPRGKGKGKPTAAGGGKRKGKK